jgi:opacity protein-like surface antigen
MTAKSARILGFCMVAGGSLLLAAHSARAQEGPTPTNPLGVYVGAGLGLSDIRQNPEPDSSDLSMDRSTVGWDAFVGLRPVPYLGAEIGYLDFGSAHQYAYAFTPTALPPQSRFHESADAPVAFAVGYIPLQPWWDLYVKAGGASLHKAYDSETPGTCPPGAYCPVGYDAEVYFSERNSSWGFAYGVGTQVSFGPVAWRLEYVRVNATGNYFGGDPDMLSAGVSWRFF